MTVVLGIHTTPRLLPLHPMELFDGRRITGCIFGDFKGKSQLPEIVEKCMKGVCSFSIRKTKILNQYLYITPILFALPNKSLISFIFNFSNFCMQEIKINFDGFITHELPFEEINQAFKLLEEGKSLRCLLHL